MPVYYLINFEDFCVLLHCLVINFTDAKFSSFQHASALNLQEPLWAINDEV